MRVEIKTQNPVKDKDVKAMYLIGFAFRIIDKRMIKPTLDYFADYFGYKLINKI